MIRCSSRNCTKWNFVLKRDFVYLWAKLIYRHFSVKISSILPNYLKISSFMVWIFRFTFKNIVVFWFSTKCTGHLISFLDDANQFCYDFSIICRKSNKASNKTIYADRVCNVWECHYGCWTWCMSAKYDEMAVLIRKLAEQLQRENLCAHTHTHTHINDICLKERLSTKKKNTDYRYYYYYEEVVMMIVKRKREKNMKNMKKIEKKSLFSLLLLNKCTKFYDQEYLQRSDYN